MIDARSVLEEYSTNIIDGYTIDGEFFIVTCKTEYLTDIIERLIPLNYTCSHTDYDGMNPDYCMTTFEPVEAETRFF